MSNRLKSRTIIFIVLGFAVISAYGQENLFKNHGFEFVSKGIPQNCISPDYWSGIISQDKEIFRSGKASAKLLAKEKSGKHWGRFMQPLTVKIIPGAMYRFSMWVKGEGEFVLGVLQYAPTNPGVSNYKYFWQEKPVVLTNEWREISYEFTIDNPDINRITPVAEVRGENAVVFMDDQSFGRFTKDGVELNTSTGHFMSYPGGEYELVFKLAEQKQSAEKRDIGMMIISPGDWKDSVEVKIDDNGVGRHVGVFPPDAQPGSWRFVGFVKDTGAVAEVLCELVDQSTYDEMDATAKKIRVKTPMHILYIGDSLTDYLRGNNYVDKVNFWLSKYNEKVSFRNAGVGGDLITRVLSRLNGIDGGPSAYRQAMYKGLFEPKPDLIFILLGHNDTLLRIKDGKEILAVSPEVQEDTYRKTLTLLKEKTGAEIVLVSATSSVYEICKQSNDKRVASGGTYFLFGKPEVMENFNRVLKKLADELNIDYIDVYQPMKDYPNKPSLFSPADGVHLSEKGNRIIAIELLKYLADK